MTAKRTELIQFPEAAAQVEKAALRAVRGREDYRRYVRDYFSWIREKSLAPADPLTLRRYIRELGKRYSGGSYAPILAAIKNGLRGAARALLSAVEAAAVAEALRTVKAPRKATNAIRRDAIISPEEERAALAAMTPRDAALFRFLLKTGARISEALGIRLEDAKLSPDLVEIPIMGKGDKMRTLRVCRELWDEVRAAYPGGVYLFETREGKPVNRTYAYRRISGAVRAATGKDFSPHGARHTWATRAIAKTGKIKSGGGLPGHSSVSITLDLYTHEELTDDELAGI